MSDQSYDGKVLEGLFYYRTQLDGPFIGLQSTKFCWFSDTPNKVYGKTEGFSREDLTGFFSLKEEEGVVRYVAPLSLLNNLRNPNDG